MSEFFSFHSARFYSRSLKDLIDKINERLHSNENQFTTFIATPNPEMYVESILHPEFATVLKNTSFNIVDGFGLHCLMRLFKYPSERITGTDLVKAIFRKNLGSVYILGGMPGNYATIKKKYPNVKLLGYFEGVVSEDNSKALAQEINELSPDFLLVALGAPKQEKWIVDNLKNIQNVKVAIGIGGAIDYLSGNIKRAPSFVRSMGLEWIYRLFNQPSRYKRIIKAVIVFPILFIAIEGSLLLWNLLKRAYTQCKKTCRF